jgi:N-acetylneuraminate synthase/N,N'-diacetyllegionaminate synthase
MSKVKIIAEVGVNHNGNIDLARKMIKAAADSGADFVKFQTYVTENIVSKSAPKANYQIKNTNTKGTQFEMLKRLELGIDDHYKLIECCKSHGVTFLSSAFDLESLNFLKNTELPLFKIPSGEITNYPYLKAVSEINKPVILSTGMATLEEVERSFKLLSENGLKKHKITILHCNTEYPTPYDDVNLLAMKTLSEKFQVAVGYSDHTIGSEVAIAAVALGAEVIEKHFTMDRNLPGPDHKASMEPNEFKIMTQAIRNVEKAISGDGEKIPSRSEIKNIPIARKSIYISQNLDEGTVLEDYHLISLRPGTGISPMRWNELIGKSINKSLGKGHQLTWDDLVL